jgi:hypothetical protein
MPSFNIFWSSERNLDKPNELHINLLIGAQGQDLMCPHLSQFQQAVTTQVLLARISQAMHRSCITHLQVP